MFTPATIKAIQDIMRQDIGVDGDATRLSQMVWLIFLKILDDEDKALEIRKDKFIPTLPNKYQWRTWAGPLDGMTGDKLIEFVNNDLLPGLRDLPDSGNKRTDLTRMAFQDVYNFMRKGTLLKQVINKINEIDFNASKDRHAFNEIYERLLKSLQSAGNFGEMYTPRAVTQFIVEMVDPKIGESVLDPAVGTGGFLVHSLEHLRKQVKSVKDEQKIQQSIHGVEKKPLPFMLLITNMMLHGIEEPLTMRRGNTLERPLREYTDADKVDCVVTNPPFGGTEEPGIETNFPKEFQTRETADLFLVLIIRLLKKHGRAGMILPDSILLGEGMKTSLKKMLLEECNLHTIVRLPKNVFAPYTSINTNLLFFTKGEPTKEIWYYEHPYPEGKTSYSTSSPITIGEFDVEKEWWTNRVENDQSWKVSIKEIQERNYNLDIKNPNTIGEIVLSPKELLSEYRIKQLEIKKVLDKIQNSISESLSYHKTIPENIATIINNLEDFIKIPQGIDILQKEITTLAISGQLVPQNLKEDGIVELNVQSIGKTRKSKKYQEKSQETKLISKQEIPFDIPTSWKWVRFGDVCDAQGGSQPPKSKFVYEETPNYVRFLQIRDFSSDNNITFIPINNKNKMCDKEDILIGRYGASVGKILTGKSGAYNVAIIKTFPDTALLNKEYFYNFLLSDYMQRWFSSLTRAAQAGFNKDDLFPRPLPLPPFTEQKRIVKKIKEITVLIDQLKDVVGGNKTQGRGRPKK